MEYWKEVSETLCVANKCGAWYEMTSKNRAVRGIRYAKQPSFYIFILTPF